MRVLVKNLRVLHIELKKEHDITRFGSHGVMESGKVCVYCSVKMADQAGTVAVP